jgi:hypothetical protein
MERVIYLIKTHKENSQKAIKYIESKKDFTLLIAKILKQLKRTCP